MTLKRIILEMGTGNDLYGGDYTKAAIRAVDDALHHSSITMFRTLGYSHEDMQVRVTIGVQDVDAVDITAVTAHLPRGNAVISVVQGGLDVREADGTGKHIVATAAIEAFLDVDATDWVLDTAQS
jgi:uncharacterized protein (TIGR02058 family)